ncbi:WGxxGxxG family protein [Amycolatopsis palatopharyngis]|uniref:WGxxGxxG family protein n=1 Tax=Amycolatopsis palatopharyngis TaxID=187982 RepID=UPI0013BE951F|nr:WGxxGxxG family protein [Amycolatopsis palatopharyngis]
MSKRMRVWAIAATVGVAMSSSPLAAAQPAPQERGYGVPLQVQEADPVTEDDDGLWGLLGLAGLLGLLGLLRRSPRRDHKNALAGYPAASQPAMPDANGAFTPPGGQPIPPQAAGPPPATAVPAPSSGEVASEKPLRRWP